MRKFLLALLLTGCATPAFACTGGPITSITLTAPASFHLDNQATCAGVNGTASVSPSSLATAAAGALAGQWTLTPNANGTGTITFSAPGYASLTVPLTVTLGTLELDP